VSSLLSAVREWQLRRRSHKPAALVEKEPSAWPWLTTAYLIVLFFVTFGVPADPCDRGWTWARLTLSAAVLTSVLDASLIGLRRRDTGLALLVGIGSLLAALAVCGLFIFVRYYHDACV
jgi:hypothetical protein